jgi:hypothetical protein
MVEPADDFPKCSFCGVSATDLSPCGTMVHSEKNPDVWICESCIRDSYELIQGGGTEITN